MNANSRIAKNAIYLYIRTFFVLIVSLYTSRLILQALGQTDLGIYNVVGGIVTLMAFFQQAQTKATSRFITYELGNKNNKGEPEKIFSICFTIHVLISLIVLLLGETIGLFIVNHWIDIPADRMVAANCVYQFALFTFCIHLIQVPYTSVIIAHEAMSIYAYITMAEVVLKLFFVYVLLLYGDDKLIFYGGMLAWVAGVSLFTYVLYIKRKYPLYKTYIVWNKEKFVKILSFSGWSLLGSSANTATQQGVSLLFNKFVGLVANTALGFANQINGAVGQFVGSFTTAFNPQIFKLYAQHNYSELHLLIIRASKFSFSLAYLITLPLIVNMDYILHIWLENVPQYTSLFCKFILVCSIIDATSGVFNTSISATGKIKYYQLGISMSFLLDLILAFVFLKFGLHPAFVFVSRIVTRGFLNMCIGFYFSKILLFFPLEIYFRDVLLPILITLVITIFFSQIIYFSGWIGFITKTFICLFSVSVCTLFIIMTYNERIKIIRTIKHKIYG